MHLGHDGEFVSTARPPPFRKHHKGSYFLDTLEGFVTIGQATWYNMEGCMENMDDIITCHRVFDVVK